TSIIAAGLAGLFLLAFLSPRANRQGVYIGVLACLIFTTWATLTSGKDPTWNMGSFNFKLHPVMIGVLGHLVLFAVCYVASLFFAAPEKEFRAMTLWGWLENRKKINVSAESSDTRLINTPLQRGDLAAGMQTNCFNSFPSEDVNGETFGNHSSVARD